jgi:hypothetical protein
MRYAVETFLKAGMMHVIPVSVGLWTTVVSGDSEAVIQVELVGPDERLAAKSHQTWRKSNIHDHDVALIVYLWVSFGKGITDSPAKVNDCVT